jgi:putative transcriptional regulator
MKSLQGHFLVAAPHQLDPNFVEALILVLAHDHRGAMGVIVSCPRDRQEGISQQRSTKRRWPQEPRLYFGGPVTGPLMAVHRDRARGEIEILPGLFFSGGEENVRAVMLGKRQPCRVFAGYTGWAPKQLEYEIDLGVWRTVEATAERVLSHSEDLWYELHSEAVGTMFRTIFNLKHVPRSPMLN